MQIKLAISIVLAFLALVVIVQNTDNVQLEFFAWSLELSLVLLIFLVLLVGFLIGWLLNSYLRISRQRKKRSALTTDTQANITDQGMGGHDD